jgi:hypothetical protein
MLRAEGFHAAKLVQKPTRKPLHQQKSLFTGELLVTVSHVFKSISRIFVLVSVAG